MSASKETVFFNDDFKKNVIRTYSSILRESNYSEDDSFRYLVRHNLQRILIFFLRMSSNFDKLAPVTIDVIGEVFISEMTESMRSRSSENHEVVERIFVIACRFIFEVEFNTPKNRSGKFRELAEFVDLNIDKFSHSNRLDLIHSRYLLPSLVMKNFLHSEEINNFKAYRDHLQGAIQFKDEWDKDYEKNHQKVIDLKDNLKSIASEYNFVGLVKGFQSLGKQKIFEKRVAFYSLIFLAVLMVILPLYQTNYILSNFEVLKNDKELLLYSLPTILTVELIILYLFRVVLAHFRSVKAQNLQIDLRIALCQFIENYSAYSVAINKESPNALERFEALIFSNLVPHSENIPSTFDGIDQIAKLLGSVKK